MTTVAPATVYQRLVAAGFSPAAATTMTAISLAESGDDPTARGDLGLQNATWGPSYGLFQIRTLKAETGKGTTRDINALTSIDAQAKAAYDISRGGTDFTPWSTWTSKAYQKFMGTAVAATNGAVIDPGTTGGGTVVQNAGLTLNPSDWVSAAAGVVKPIVFEGVFVVLGLGLVGFGLARVFAPQIKAAKSAAKKAGKTAAMVAAPEAAPALAAVK